MARALVLLWGPKSRAQDLVRSLKKIRASGTYNTFTKAMIDGQITELDSSAFAACSALVDVSVTAPVTT